MRQASTPDLGHATLPRMATILWENGPRKVLFDTERSYVVTIYFPAAGAVESSIVLGKYMPDTLSGQPGGPLPIAIHVYRVNDRGTLTKINIGEPLS